MLTAIFFGVIVVLLFIIASQASNINSLTHSRDRYEALSDEFAGKLEFAKGELKEERRCKQSLLNEVKSSDDAHRKALNSIYELNQQLRERRRLKGIKFVANIPMRGWTTTEFKLGVGPCGLTVDSLQWEEQDDRYVLTQRHTDGSRKVFEYKKEDVQGRIEMYYPAPGENNKAH